MSNSRSVASLSRLLRAIETMDAAACAAAFTPDGVMNTPCLPSTFPRTRRGREDIEQVFTFLFTAVFTNFAWLDLEVHATENPALVFARCRSRAELRDGRLYQNEYASHAQIKDGLVQEYTEFFDTERAIESFKHLQQA